MASNLRRDEEEIVFRKRLLYDGHGSGEDKRLVNILKNTTKFCLTEESTEDMIKTYNVITKDLAAASNASEKQEKISHMLNRTFLILEKAIENKVEHIENVKCELANLVLELEYVEKLKQVEAFPNCQTTEQAMKDIESRKQLFLFKIEKQRRNLHTLIEACRNLQKVLEDGEDEIRMDCITLPDYEL